jgi:magnesium-transporting ATPase (P-type)
MRTTAFASLLLASFGLVYVCNQLFFIDPAIASNQYFPNVLSNFFMWAIMFFALILIVLFVFLFCGFKTLYRKKARNVSVLTIMKTVDPPGREKFEIFMFVAFVFSFTGTFSHDVVIYALGALAFVLPIFFDPYICKLPTANQSENVKGLKWDMICAIIALVALAWEIAKTYL